MGELSEIYLFKSHSLTAIGPYDVDPIALEWRMSVVEVGYDGIYILRGNKYLVRPSSIESIDLEEMSVGTMLRIRLKRSKRSLFILGPANSIVQLRNTLNSLIRRELSIDESDIKLLAFLGSGVKDEVTLKRVFGDWVLGKIATLKEIGLLDESLRPTQLAVQTLCKGLLEQEHTTH